MATIVVILAHDDVEWRSRCKRFLRLDIGLKGLFGVEVGITIGLCILQSVMRRSCLWK